MDALIIAAGFGSRLRELSDSKPLTPVAGIRLIELGIRQAVAAGVTRVIVVTGHRADEVEGFLADLSARSGMEIVAERLSDWSTPNGYSVIAGAARCAGDYLLMMADHMFDVEILRHLLAQGAPERGVTLAVDNDVTSPLVDPDDATWVQRAEDGRIRAIGKTIPDYDAVDCGAFLATPELAEAIKAAIAAGKPGSLSDGMQRLADAGRAWTMEVEGRWWMDVDDPRAHALAERDAPVRLAPAFAAARAEAAHTEVN